MRSRDREKSPKPQEAAGVKSESGGDGRRVSQVLVKGEIFQKVERKTNYSLSNLRGQLLSQWGGGGRCDGVNIN